MLAAARSDSRQAAPPAARPTAVEPKVLALQRAVGNRAVGTLLRGRALARDPDDAAQVEARQRAAEAGARSSIQATAKTALAVLEAYRGGVVGVTGSSLVATYVPDHAPELKDVRYEPLAAGVAIQGSSVVLGDEALKRLATGAVDAVGADLRAAVGVLADARFAAKAQAIVWLGGERVLVRSKDEIAQAERIVKRLRETFGVQLDSAAVRADVRKDKAERGRSAAVVRAIDVEPWRLVDLEDLEQGLQPYAAVLGPARASSTRAPAPQEVVRAGRLTQLETADAQYVPGGRSFAVYHSQADTTAGAEPEPSTIVHEVAHGILAHRLEAFRKDIGYWEHRGERGVEAPPTPYAAKNPDEDLADSVMLFFTARDFLVNGQKGKRRGQVGNPCPKRLRWIEKEIASWKPAAVKGAAVKAPADGRVLARDATTWPADRKMTPASMERLYQQALRTNDVPLLLAVVSSFAPDADALKLMRPLKARGAAVLQFASTLATLRFEWDDAHPVRRALAYLLVEDRVGPTARSERNGGWALGTSAGTTTTVPDGTVRVYDAVTDPRGGRHDLFALRYEGRHAEETGWLQFVALEAEAFDAATGGAGTPLHGEVGARYQGASLEYGTAKEPKWSLDSIGDPLPFYEAARAGGTGAGSAIIRYDRPGAPGETTMIDRPQADPEIVKRGFRDDDTRRVERRARFHQYLVRGPDVLFENELVVQDSYWSARDLPVRANTFGRCGPADRVAPEHFAALVRRRPEFAYFAH